MIVISLILSVLAVQAFAGIPAVFRKITPTIVGGTPANAGEFPYQIQLLYYDSHYCGGSIVGPSTIVTAAHCVYGESRNVFTVRAGHTSDSNPESTAQTRYVSNIITHPNYNPDTTENDIAILKLSSPFTFNTYVNKIVIPAQGSTTGTASGTNLVATGWGATSEGGNGSDQLLKVTLPVVSNSKCNTAYGGGITNSMICAGTTQGGKDTCQGDSGGPLATMSGTRTLLGVVSFGYGCARPDVPGVYTRVPSFSNWIKQYTT